MAEIIQTTKTIPTGVKVIAVFCYIVAGLFLLLSLASFFGGAIFGSLIGESNILGLFGGLGTVMFIIMGIIK